MKLNLIDEAPWYQEGLHFKCTECGKCCTGMPGYAWVTEEEIIQMASYLKINVDQFAKKYLRLVQGRFALLENQIDYSCIFLRDKKCTIYPARPKQCRTFPWWAQNLKSREEWENASKYCEGINPQAPIVPLNVIQDALNDH